MEKQQQYCCKKLRYYMKTEKAVVPDFLNKNDKNISYIIEALVPALDEDWETDITNHEDKTILKMKGDYTLKAISIDYCPWCGVKLSNG
jgi:hypothetical protein